MGRESISGSEFSRAAHDAFVQAVDGLVIRNLARTNDLASLAPAGVSHTGEKQVAALTNDDMQRSGGRSEGLV